MGYTMTRNDKKTKTMGVFEIDGDRGENDHNASACHVEAGVMSLLIRPSVDKGKKRKCSPFASPPILAFFVGGPSGSPSEVAIALPPPGYHIYSLKFSPEFHKFLQIIFSQVAILAARGRYKW